MSWRARDTIFAVMLGAVPLAAMAAPPQRDACTDARNEDNARAQAQYSKDARDALTARDDALRACGDSSSCKRQAGEQYTERMKQVIQALEHERAEVYKQEVDCRLEAKLKRGQSAQKPETPDATDPTSTGTLYKLRAELDDIRGNLLDNVLAAGDQFFKGLLDWGSGLLQLMAQPRGSFTEFGEPLKQIIDYVVNHKPESFAQQYERAQKAIEEFKQNPARVFGQQIPNLAPLPTAGAAAQVRAAATAAQRLARVNAAANRFAPIARRLVTPTNLPKQLSTTTPPPLRGVGTAGPPSRGGRLPPEPPAGSYPDPSGIPPTCFENGCFKNIQAVDEFRRTGVWREPVPPGLFVDSTTPTPLVFQELKNAHGGSRALDPLHGPDGQFLHAQGFPVSSSKGQIETAMGNLGPGAQGYVFVNLETVVGAVKTRWAHAVNVWTEADGSVTFFDRATLKDPTLRGAASPQMWQLATETFFMRTK